MEFIEIQTLLKYAWLVLLLPLCAVLLNVFLFRSFPYIASRISTLFCALSSFYSLKILHFSLSKPGAFEINAANFSKFSSSIEWLPLNPSFIQGPQEGFSIYLGVFLDPLSIMMISMITLIATLIHIYSLGYMKGDPGEARFFTYLSLFTFSMLGLVFANNFVQMFVFWELVGLCSYLLIGFYISKKSAGDAAKKAFIVTRFADLGFLIAILILAFYTHEFNFFELAERDFSPILNTVNFVFFSIPFLPVLTLLLFMGAMGKSGQLPFHIWLPDAMEGPTPVSALIHAATMVTAGVFMLARCFPLFHSGEQMILVAYMGGLTALIAATIAIVQFDIKKILAYSTLSQLGYMVMAMGVEGSIDGGDPTVGVFHLFTHAFFKALLFLAAGSLIHGAHSNDIRKMGGMFSYMKWTSVTFIIGALALSGIPPFAGFFSKDAILHSALHHHYNLLFGIGLISAFLTAFYMGRCCFLVFFGENQSDHPPHESPVSMVFPLVILAGFSCYVGFLHHDFTKFLSSSKINAPALDGKMALISVFVAVAGIFISYLVYRKNLVSTVKLSQTLSVPYKLLRMKYYFDEFWEFCVRNLLFLIAEACAVLDRRLIDGHLVDGWARITQAATRVLRKSQVGIVQVYILFCVFFMSVFTLGLL